MKEYSVDLTGRALVKQHHIVQANSQEEAEKIALEQHNDEVWRYQGIDDASVEVAFVRSI